MRSRTRRIIVLTFALATLAVLALAVYASLDPEYYFFYTAAARSHWVYNASSVAIVCGLILIEGLIACAAFVARRPRLLAVRVSLALLLFLPWAYILALGVMHAPGYVMYHVLWVWLLGLVLLAGLFASGIRRALLWVRTEPPNNSIQRTRYARR